ncbi:MAG: polymerase subunit sigma-24 [Ilumatobacteraceae bacterium]|nr:polymerase subunit sigma-24 [Ilumatobacteraceae bacterium]
MLDRRIGGVLDDGVVMGTDARERDVSSDSSFAAFYDASVAEVFRYFRKGTGGDRRWAEDLTQDTYTAAVNAYRRGLDDALTMPWLMTVARNKLIDSYRRRSRERSKLARIGSQHHAIETTEFELDEHEALELLGHLIPIHRLVLVLRYVDDLSVGEVAEALGRSVHATESLLARARRAVQRAIPHVASRTGVTDDV